MTFINTLIYCDDETCTGICPVCREEQYYGEQAALEDDECGECAAKEAYQDMLQS